MLRSPVFIVGSPRSGTSILVDAMLALGYKGFREGQFLPLAYFLQNSIDTHFNHYAYKTTEVLISVLDRDKFKREILEVFKRTVETTIQEGAWFDKTGNPEMILAIPMLREIWPTSKFIFSKRRGIENLASRTRKFRSLSFELHCRDWARNMSSWRKIRSELPDDIYIEVDQQDLIQSPEMSAGIIAQFLGEGITGSPKVAHVLTKNRPQQSEAGSAERVLTLAETGWPEEQRAMFMRFCAEEMRAFNYTMDERYSTRLLGAAFAIKSPVKPAGTTAPPTSPDAAVPTAIPAKSPTKEIEGAAPTPPKAPTAPAATATPPKKPAKEVVGTAPTPSKSPSATAATAIPSKSSTKKAAGTAPTDRQTPDYSAESNSSPAVKADQSISTKG